MTVELQINNSTSPDARFLGWAPSPCRIRLTNPSGMTGPSVDLKLTAQAAAGGGQLVFRTGQTGSFSASISLSVPTKRTALDAIVKKPGFDEGVAQNWAHSETEEKTPLAN